MSRKFKPGDTVTNGITTKNILFVQERMNHYLTNCGVIWFGDEDDWRIVKKGGGHAQK